MRSNCTLLLCIVVALCVSSAVWAQPLSVPVFRLASLGVRLSAANEPAEGDVEWRAVGARSDPVNLQLVAAPLGDATDGAAARRGALLNRKAVLVKAQDLHKGHLELLADDLHVGAVVVVLEAFQGRPPPAVASHWHQLHTLLLGRAWPMPVLFVDASEEIDTLYSTLGAGRDTELGMLAPRYELSVPLRPVKEVANPAAVNIQCLLHGAPRSGESAAVANALPTVVVVAHYDTFSVAPGVPSGTDSNGSGVISLLHLANVFSSVFADAATRPAVNVAFVTTGAGKFGFRGAQHWAAHVDTGLPGPVQLVVCLDSIGSAAPLHVHGPVTAAAPVQRFLDSLQAAAASQGQSVRVHRHGDSAGDNQPPNWEHEAVARSGVGAAVTVTGLTSASSPWRTSVLDRHLNTTALVGHMQVLADALAAVLLPDTVTTQDAVTGVFAAAGAAAAPDVEWVRDWSVALARSSRFVAEVETNGPLVKGLMASMPRRCKVAATRVPLDGAGYKFYDAADVAASITVVRPIPFHAGVLACIGCYLVGMYVAVRALAGT